MLLLIFRPHKLFGLRSPNNPQTAACAFSSCQTARLSRRVSTTVKDDGEKGGEKLSFWKSFERYPNNEKARDFPYWCHYLHCHSSELRGISRTVSHMSQPAINLSIFHR